MNDFDNLIDALYAAPDEKAFITAWIDEDEQETVTFGEFRRRSCAQGRALCESGMAAGDFVLLVMPQCITAMEVFVGAMMFGGVPSFLAYPNFKVEPDKYRTGLAGVTANLNARLVVVDEEFPDELLGHVALGKEGTLLRAVGGLANGSNLPRPKIAPEQVAFVQHSAGTTGLQKGVALSHSAVLRQLHHLARAVNLRTESDRIYSWLPLYHDMGLIAGFMLPMVYHLPIVMQSPLEWVMRPQNMLCAIEQHRCTLAWQPNFAFQFLARRTPQDQRSHYDLSSVRALINCSEPIRASSMAEFQSAFSLCGLRVGALQSSYAMAENVFAVTQSDVQGPKQVWADLRTFRNDHCVLPVEAGTAGAVCFVSSGKVIQSVEIRVISDNGTQLPTGQVGEIILRSDCLFDGYCNRPDLTAKVLIDGWYHTGDLGFLLDGELFVVGRKKDLIIVGGENLYPQDIEEIVTQHSAIQEGRSVAMGVYNSELGTESVVVVAEVKDPALLADAATIERELRASLVAAMGVAVRTIYLKPPKWIVKSTAGKPARAATREKLQREHPELNSAEQE